MMFIFDIFLILKSNSNFREMLLCFRLSAALLIVNDIFDYIKANNGSSFECTCRQGYTGLTCSTNINECASQPCQNNGRCLDLVNGFACQCSGFFVGARCEQAFNFCADGPCATGSTCVSNSGNFTCLCPAGKAGSLCEKDVEACGSMPCRNGGLCVNEGTSGEFRCLCLGGFTGRLCEATIDYCASPLLVQCVTTPCLSGCQNNATCVSSAAGFSCKCRPGFEGTLCETRIDFCRSGKKEFGFLGFIYFREIYQVIVIGQKGDYVYCGTFSN